MNMTNSFINESYPFRIVITSMVQFQNDLSPFLHAYYDIYNFSLNMYFYQQRFIYSTLNYIKMFHNESIIHI